MPLHKSNLELIYLQASDDKISKLDEQKTQTLLLIHHDIFHELFEGQSDLIIDFALWFRIRDHPPSLCLAIVADKCEN